MGKLAGTTSLMQLVSFLLGKETFALDVMKIKGVERLSEITAIPRFPDFMEGIIHLRGKIIPIIDLRKRFGIPSREHDKETRVVLVELGQKTDSTVDIRFVKDNEAATVGLIVDKVFEVFQLDVSEMGQIPRLGSVSSIDNRFVRGVAEIRDKLVIILDIEKIFSAEELEELSEHA